MVLFETSKEGGTIIGSGVKLAKAEKVAPSRLAKKKIWRKKHAR
jgi:hypothetical protein